MNILVLSPHRDDAAFSLSLSIAAWLGAGHLITILNVFTRSLYAPYAGGGGQTDSARLALVSAVRKGEDQSFLAAMKDGSKVDLTMVDLDLMDAPIRLHCDSSTVCDMDVLSSDKTIPIIREAVTQLTQKHPSDGFALVLPLGLGHHVDHRTSRDAALPFTTEMPCAFYEDLPYANRPGVRVDLSRFRQDANTRFHEPLCPVLCHGTHAGPEEFKRRIALLYKSQIDRDLADEIATFSRRYGGGERLWANRAWLSLARGEQLSSPQRETEAEPLPA